MTENTNHSNSTDFQGIKLSRKGDIGIVDPANIVCITSKPLFDRDDEHELENANYEEIKHIGVDDGNVLLESENNRSVHSRDYIDEVMFVLGIEEIEYLIDEKILVGDEKPVHFEVEENLFVVVAPKIGSFNRENFDMVETGVDVYCPACGEFCVTDRDNYKLEDIDFRVFCENKNCHINSFIPSKIGESREQ